MKKGFTLVELSIVLVIVGLLVGGILVGQSMISTARNTAFIKQIQQYDIIVTTYKQINGYLPGDDPKGSLPGNGDGIVYYVDDNEFAGEIATFWQDVTNAGLLPDNEKYTSAGSGIVAGNGGNIPKANLVDRGNFGIYVGVCADGCVQKAMETTYWVSRFPTTVRNTWGGACGWSWPRQPTDLCGPALSPVTAQAVDSKMDDGSPMTGNVWAGAYNEFDDMTAQPLGSALGCHNGTRYWNEDNQLQCALKIKVMWQTQ